MLTEQAIQQIILETLRAIQQTQQQVAADEQGLGHILMILWRWKAIISWVLVGRGNVTHLNRICEQMIQIWAQITTLTCSIRPNEY